MQFKGAFMVEGGQAVNCHRIWPQFQVLNGNVSCETYDLDSIHFFLCLFCSAIETNNDRHIIKATTPDLEIIYYIMEVGLKCGVQQIQRDLE